MLPPFNLFATMPRRSNGMAVNASSEAMEGVFKELAAITKRQDEELERQAMIEQSVLLSLHKQDEMATEIKDVKMGFERIHNLLALLVNQPLVTNRNPDASNAPPRGNLATAAEGNLGNNDPAIRAANEKDLGTPDNANEDAVMRDASNFSADVRSAGRDAVPRAIVNTNVPDIPDAPNVPNIPDIPPPSSPIIFDDPMPDNPPDDILSTRLDAAEIPGPVDAAKILSPATVAAMTENEENIQVTTGGRTVENETTDNTSDEPARNEAASELRPSSIDRTMTSPAGAGRTRNDKKTQAARGGNIAESGMGQDTSDESIPVTYSSLRGKTLPPSISNAPAIARRTRRGFRSRILDTPSPSPSPPPQGMVDDVSNASPLAQKPPSVLTISSDDEDFQESRPVRPSQSSLKARRTNSLATKKKKQHRRIGNLKRKAKEESAKEKKRRRVLTGESTSSESSSDQDITVDSNDDGSAVRNRQILSPARAERLADTADDFKSAFFKDGAMCPTKVLKMFQVAAESRNLLAMLRMGEMYLHGAVSINPDGYPVKKDYHRAGVYLEELLEHPDLKDVNDEEDLHFEIKAKALCYLGDVWYFKDGDNCNDDAEEQYKKAAAMGDAFGQFKIGWLYLQKRHRAKKPNKQHEYLLACLKEWEKAVNMGSGLAATEMGTMYDNDSNDDLILQVITAHEGRELTEDEREKKAEMLYKKSIYEDDCPLGYNNMAVCYDVGFVSISPDANKSISMYRQAFEMGYAGAADNLGVLYEEGGSPPMFKDCIDHQQALIWYKKGSLCECPLATLHLAEWYDKGKVDGSTGEIVGRDREEALKLYHKSYTIFNRTLQHKEKCSEAIEGLFKLCCFCILIEEPEAEKTAKRIIKLFASGKKKLKETRDICVWMVGLELKPEVYEKTRGAADAMQKLDSQLGYDKATEIYNRIQVLCQHIRGGDIDIDVQDKARDSLRLLVVDTKLRASLGIEDYIN